MPEWLRVWWEYFGNESTINILSIANQQEVVGLAPLQIKDNRATFIGSINVCDYLDFIITTGKEGVFFETLLGHLAEQGIKDLDLGLLRPDSTVRASLVNVAENRGCKVSISPEDVSLEIELPPTWDDYLRLLKGKQRHEVKRKFRRLHEAGDVDFRIVEDPDTISDQLPTFFDLFKLSSDEKAVFMTGQMLSFFQALTTAMAEAKILKLYMLHLNGKPVAASMCFDFDDTLHLYNSGFHPRFRALSVGLLCKVLSLKDAIEKRPQKIRLPERSRNLQVSSGC